MVDEAVHDAHRLAGNFDVSVNLLENLEDVDLVSIDALLVLFFLSLAAAELLSGLWLLFSRSFLCDNGLSSPPRASSQPLLP